MAHRGVLEVASKERNSSSNVRTSTEAEPVKTTNNRLVRLHQNGFVDGGNAIVGLTVDGKSPLVGSGDGPMALQHVVLVQHLVNVAFLRHMNGKTTIGSAGPVQYTGIASS
jgi:hypothetical protein